MSEWATVPLRELCNQDRRTIRAGDGDLGGLPYLGLEHVQGDTGEIVAELPTGSDAPTGTSFEFDEGHVLYGKLRPYLNKVVVPSFRGRCSTEFIPLKPQTGVDREFLAALLRRKETVDAVMRANTGSRMPRADMKVLLGLNVPFPPYPEQRRIVDILNRANGIRRLRREAQEKARQVIPALLVEMFGDPERVDGKTPLGSVVEEFRYGTSRKATDKGFPVLRIPNVIGGSLDLTELKTVVLEDKEAKRLLLKNGDVLFVRTNGNPDYVGRCTVFEEELVRSVGVPTDQFVYASYLIRARPDPQTVNPHYLQALLSSDYGRKAMRERSRTSAGQYNINTEGLRSIPVPVPPLDLQQSFASRASDIQAMIAQQDRMAEASEELIASLMARAFEG